MGSSLPNKLLVNVGSLVAANGAILLISPRRFRRLRTGSWTPDAVDTILRQLAHPARRGRLIGAGTMALGVSLIAVGLLRTRVSG
jgi:hypothetical protein